LRIIRDPKVNSINHTRQLSIPKSVWYEYKIKYL